MVRGFLSPPALGHLHSQGSLALPIRRGGLTVQMAEQSGGLFLARGLRAEVRQALLGGLGRILLLSVGVVEDECLPFPFFPFPSLPILDSMHLFKSSQTLFTS